MPSVHLEYVGFWARLGAAFIDTVIQLTLLIPLTYAMYGRLSLEGHFFMGVGDVLLNYVAPAVVVIAFWIYQGATPGKMAVSAQIVDADTGARLSLSRSLIRYLGYVLSLVPLGLGFFWIVFDARKQGWHDKLANSVVVRPLENTPVRFERKASWPDDPIEPGL